MKEKDWNGNKKTTFVTYKQIEIGDITFNAIKNIVSDYNKVVSELKKYKNMYEAEHEIHTIRNEQLERKENSIKGDGFKCLE